MVYTLAITILLGLGLGALLIGIVEALEWVFNDDEERDRHDETK